MGNLNTVNGPHEIPCDTSKGDVCFAHQQPASLCLNETAMAAARALLPKVDAAPSGRRSILPPVLAQMRDRMRQGEHISADELRNAMRTLQPLELR